MKLPRPEDDSLIDGMTETDVETTFASVRTAMGACLLLKRTAEAVTLHPHPDSPYPFLSWGPVSETESPPFP